MAVGVNQGGMFTQINITPLTDVFLVLLVIMILVAPLTNNTVLKVSAPKTPGRISNPTEKDKTPDINVLVSAAGVITINGNAIKQPDSKSIQDVIESLQNKAGRKNLVLNLSCDEAALHKYVVAVMDAAAGAQIKQLQFCAR